MLFNKGRTVGNIWEFLPNEGGAELAIAFCALFWPDFIEVEGCIILREKYIPSSFETWWKQLDGDRTAVESVLNHVHLWDLFSGDENIPEGGLEYLGGVLRCCWECSLRQAFPGHTFDVRLAVDADEYGPTLYVTTVR